MGVGTGVSWIYQAQIKLPDGRLWLTRFAPEGWRRHPFFFPFACLEADTRV